MASSFLDLLKHLRDHHVDFVIVGETTTARVCLVGMLLAAGVVTFALHRKQHVRAGARYKNGEIFIEADDRKE